MSKNWKAYYESHTMSAEEAIAKIRDGDTLIPVEQIDCFVPYDEPLIDIAHPDFRRRLYKECLEYQRSCGMEKGLQEYMERHQYSRDWAIL